jgi:hypothetical protein
VIILSLLLIIVVKADSITKDDDLTSKYGLITEFAKLRGFFEGINQGLYTDDNITFDSGCLNNDTVRAMIKIENAIET